MWFLGPWMCVYFLSFFRNILDGVNVATQAHYIFIEFFLFGLIVIPCVFVTIRCSAVVVSYFRGDGLFAPNSGVDDIDDINCSYKHHKCNNGDESYFAKFHGVFLFVV